nr:hypothetical protein [Tanacetum cinerariifolium]
NLTRWGRALLDLSQFGTLNESKNVLREGVSKLEEALTINPAKHEVIWCLGTAYTTNAFQVSNYDEAQDLFDAAFQCFQKAVEESPETKHYLQSLATFAEVCFSTCMLKLDMYLSRTLRVRHQKNYKKCEADKFPVTQSYLVIVSDAVGLEARVCTRWQVRKLHKDNFPQGGFDQAQQTLGEGPAESSRATRSTKNKSSDLKYDICGWVILAVGIFTWIGMAQSQMPPPPAR